MNCIANYAVAYFDLVKYRANSVNVSCTDCHVASKVELQACCNTHFKHIVIFFNNFDAQNIEEYISKIIGVLAHEVFHFIHNLIIKDDKFDKNDENAVILKEALADFFSYSYLIFNQRKRTYHINTARNMFNNWVEYFGSPWKYAYALYFFIINKKYTGFIDDFSQLNTLGIIDKFKDVLYGTNHDNTSISLLKLIN